MSASSMFADIPVGVGVIYEGERIRKPQMYVELGGPNIKEKFELLRVRPINEVEDGKITIIDRDIKELEEGSSIPYGILVEVAGKDLEEEMEGVMERRIHDFCNYIEGFMHLNQRNAIWLRVSKKSVERGLSFIHIGKVLQRLFKSEIPLIEKIQITFFTNQEKVKRVYEEALKVYEARDARARGLKDEDVDVFYGCTLCQSFAPTHVCVITPQRYANCGAISWFDGRAAAKVDPKGPIFAVEKGECLDPFNGEYEGVNKVVKERTLGAITRVQLYTAFNYPHTSCGCFEATTFYVPECNGMGIVHRDFKGKTPNGLTFGAIADSTAGGRQVDGFHGLSFEYMRSHKFLKADGGWDRIIWLPSEIKERMRDYIPKEIYDKIPTEKEVNTVEELKSFLKKNKHPIVQSLKEEVKEEKEKPIAPVTIVPTQVPTITLQPQAQSPTLTPTSAEEAITLTFKNLKIYADKLIVKKKK
ncbi:MAG: CO dehydrogenase/CO-methylating acetyl-CoA synthase complex subunit beta [Nitrososphaerales archaeon]